MQHIIKRMLHLCVITSLFFSLQAVAEIPLSTRKTIAPMLTKVMPAVVNIKVQGKIPVIQQENSKSDENAQPPRFGNRKFESSGSGIIIDAKNGIIITNAHVVKYAEIITVTLDTGHNYVATLLGNDPASDIAIVKIEAKNLSELPFADSDELVVGDFVAAIGSPFGLKQTVTSGIVSGLQRSDLHIEGYEEFIQTDAPINPGNSGGALVDMDGNLIGINTAILSPAGGSVGIGFAIPANMAKSVTTQLLKHGKVQRGLVGVLVQPLSPKLAKALKSPQENAAVVTQVSPLSPAALAGIQPGDVILQVNDAKISSAAKIRNIIGLLRVGSSVKLQISRQGKIFTVTAASADPTEFAKQSKESNARLYGMNLSNFDQHLPNRGHVKGVALIGVSEESPAWNSDLRSGDVIIAINQEPTETIDDVEKLLNAKADNGLLIHILRANGAMYVVLD